MTTYHETDRSLRDVAVGDIVHVAEDRDYLSSRAPGTTRPTRPYRVVRVARTKLYAVDAHWPDTAETGFRIADGGEVRRSSAIGLPDVAYSDRTLALAIDRAVLLDRLDHAMRNWRSLPVASLRAIAAAVLGPAADPVPEPPREAPYQRGEVGLRRGGNQPSRSGTVPRPSDD